MSFEVGDQVVCVDDKLSVPWKTLNGLTRGCIYTICARVFNGRECVHLAEIVRPHGTPYGAHRFRPVRKTDISIFTAMLTKKPEYV